MKKLINGLLSFMNIIFFINIFFININIMNNFYLSGVLGVFINVLMNIYILYNPNKYVSNSLINKVFPSLTILELILSCRYILQLYYKEPVYTTYPGKAIFTVISCYIINMNTMTITQSLLFHTIFMLSILVFNGELNPSTDIFGTVNGLYFLITMAILSIKYFFDNSTETKILSFYGFMGLLSVIIPLLLGLKPGDSKTGEKFIATVSHIHNIGYLPLLPLKLLSIIIVSVVFSVMALITIIS